MRLIDTETLELKELTEDQLRATRYAVLSHRWTNDELTFKEYRKGLKKDSIGHHKIVDGCKYSRSRECPLIWIDTVCIDKRSSAELSEAINSMFRWYSKATECYVHLQDVPEPDLVDGSTFKASEWFTRGWTLQELLAPTNVIFLTAHWEVIGTRQDDILASHISAITGIGLYDVNNFNHQTPSVARKMSWTARRKTTRPEDLAYCLMGLFDVNMPLLYGEGGSKAFMRLQLEIIKKSPDKSIFAWGWESGMGAWYGLLAPSPEAFEGRGDIISSTSAEENGLPYEITNQGLCFRSKAELILGEHSSRYLIDLDCMRLVSPGSGHLERHRCYLVLEPASGNGRMFKRRHFACGGLGEDVDERYPKSRREDVGVKEFYIKQAGL